MPDQPPGSSPPVAPDTDMRAVLRIATFRRLWLALSLSSLGDWLGLLAITAMAAELTTDSSSDQNYAVASVFILRLVPALLFAPIAGVVADRLDRKVTMVVCDVGRAALFVSIPIVGSLWWLLVATFLIEALSLFWIPAKEATVPNLVPRERLEAANQLSLVTAYGSAPIAAGLFTVLSLITGSLGARFEFFVTHPASLALMLNGLTFLVAAGTVATLAIPNDHLERARAESPWRSLVEGWKFVAGTPVVRGLLIGMLGAFAAGGTVVGLAPTFVRGLGAGNPGYGTLFGAVFVGLALGMLVGPRLLAGLSRRRLFAMSIVAAGLLLMLVAVIPELAVVVLVVVLLGLASGVAWVTGYTLIGLEVADELRGRTFSFVQSMLRLTLVAVLAASPALAGAVGSVDLHPTEDVTLSYSGAAVVFLSAGAVAALVGLFSYRHMDDRKGVSLTRDVIAALRQETPLAAPIATGYFIAFEGGDGAGKSTQVQRLADWLTERGHEVVVTREPGATAIGRRLRQMLLDTHDLGLSARTEALMYAADRAEHVEDVIRPALEHGAVVITDRFIDSSIAYQAAGRALSASDIDRLSRFATRGLVPALTIVLDVSPEVAAERRLLPPDRMESESMEFHHRVRAGFLDRAARRPRRYFVMDGTKPPTEITAAVIKRVGELLPAPGTADPEPTKPLPAEENPL
ncbi:dTMP kinase [Sporichthya sp.]|uniref:dTMP kinase n=1 Tax=Sporichthya sp. TaxID=65475 RepID=UPI0018354BF3|nr:dTMP kinase [Sporichthya sp.]MBA3743989.1 dTMP kinase [Sporichthya sp.]